MSLAAMDRRLLVQRTRLVASQMAPAPRGTRRIGRSCLPRRARQTFQNPRECCCWELACWVCSAAAGVSRGTKLWLDSSGHHARSAEMLRLRRGGESLAEAQVPSPRPLDERAPNGVHEVVLDEETPEAVRPLVEVAHREVRRDGAEIGRTPTP